MFDNAAGNGEIAARMAGISEHAATVRLSAFSGLFTIIIAVEGGRARTESETERYANRETALMFPIVVPYPEPSAVQFIRDQKLVGNAVTFFNWGEYAIWHLYPEVRVSIDGRRETV